MTWQIALLLTNVWLLIVAITKTVNYPSSDAPEGGTVDFIRRQKLTQQDMNRRVTKSTYNVRMDTVCSVTGLVLLVLGVT